VVLLLAVLAAVQVIAERHNVRMDLTPSRRLSLSQTTRQILGQLEDDLYVEAYYARGHRREAADLLERFADENLLVHYELFDVDRYPERARAGGIRHAGRARIAYRDVHSIVSTASEEYLAGGVLRVIRGKIRRVYFLRGHGERSPDRPGTKESYSLVRGALRAENAEMRALDLSLSSEVPDDAAAVVIAGPTQDLLTEEIEALHAYLARGGAVLALLDPVPLPRLSAFLARYDVQLGDNLIVDRSGQILGAEELFVRVPYYSMHPVTAPTDVPVLMVVARTVEATSLNAEVRAQAVARTVESAWATPEIEAARRGDARYREERDTAGPLPVMVAVSLKPAAKGERGGRLVVIGDADFAADGYLDGLGNRDLVLNGVSWLTDEEALIARRPREIAEIVRPLSPLVLTRRQSHMLFVVAVVVEPGLLLLTGTVVVIVRRRRG
jgi:ABC-type uncharacterized transport system involved in gliding motility auxiliary subunit